MWGDPQWHVGVDPASAEAQVRGWFYGLGVTCMRYRPAKSAEWCWVQRSLP